MTDITLPTPGPQDIWGAIVNAAVMAVRDAADAAMAQIDSAVSAAIADHLAAEDPHPQYALMLAAAAGARIVGASGTLPAVDGVNVRDGDYVIFQP